MAAGLPTFRFRRGRFVLSNIFQILKEKKMITARHFWIRDGAILLEDPKQRVIWSFTAQTDGQAQK